LYAEEESKLLCFCVGLEKHFDVHEEFILNSPKGILLQ
jgi:hypothetical protein